MAYTPIGMDLPGYGSLGSLGPDSMQSPVPTGLQSGQYSGHHSMTGVGGMLSSRLDQQLSCAICLERYDEPRVLNCSHSFCRRCLIGVVERGDTDNPDRTGELYRPRRAIYFIYESDHSSMYIRPSFSSQRCILCL